MADNFQSIGISSELENILKKGGITKPTPIQEQAIPQILNGADIIAQAYTGTGKTFAFMLPIIQNIDVETHHIQALIVAPTRELAIQITNEAKKLAEVKDLNILAVYGGQDVDRQLKKLNKGVHIVIGTPGRLLDHMRRGSIEFSRLKAIVLDEADEMLNMGFLNDIEFIINKTPRERQTMLFSATMPKGLRNLAKRYMRDPQQIMIQGNNVTLEEIQQVVVKTTDREKLDALCNILDEQRPFMAIIFCRTKRRVKSLNDDLRSRGYNSDEIHGDLSQAKRENVIKSFRNMKIQFLVATDVAARGLDIEGITHIFNYDIPEDPESYIHRIGRTGRAGETGMAFTFVSPRDELLLKEIEKKIVMNINARTVEKPGQKPKSEKKNTKEKTNSKRASFGKDNKKDFKKDFKKGFKKDNDKRTSKKDSNRRDKKR